VSGGGKSNLKIDQRCDHLHAHHHRRLRKDMKAVREIIGKRLRQRFRVELENHGKDARPVLSRNRSLGSVIKLLSPSPAYNDRYNEWLAAIPERI
jgi:hypothetical protein